MDKLALGRKLGIYHEGWRLEHYFRDAIGRYGWVCLIKWGEKGAMKSSSMLADGYAVYHNFDEFIPALNRRGEPILDARSGDPIKVGAITNWEDMEAWDDVKKSWVFRPRNFTDILRDSIKNRYRIAWVGWDDVNIHLPRSMYFTKRRLWETLAKNWEGMRSNINIFECTAPRKDRVASFILGDMNWESLCSNQLMEAVRRWFWESDYYEPEKVNKYRIDVEEKPIVRDHVPKEIWDWYWNLKMELTDESTLDMVATLDEIDKPKEEKPKAEQRPEVERAQAIRERVTPE